MEICFLLSVSGVAPSGHGGMASDGLPSPEELIALSTEMAPLRSADEAAKLAAAMHTFPEGMPRRTAHVTVALQAASAVRQFCDKQIGILIDRLFSSTGASGWLQHVASCLPCSSDKTVVLVPEAER